MYTKYIVTLQYIYTFVTFGICYTAIIRILVLEIIIVYVCFLKKTTKHTRNKSLLCLKHQHFLHRTFWAHTTQKFADHLQETKAHYCIIQQNTLTNLVIIEFTLNLLASNLASRVMRTHHIRRDNSYRSILLVATLSVASLCSVSLRLYFLFGFLPT